MVVRLLAHLQPGNRRLTCAHASPRRPTLSKAPRVRPALVAGIAELNPERDQDRPGGEQGDADPVLRRELLAEENDAEDRHQDDAELVDQRDASGTRTRVCLRRRHRAGPRLVAENDRH